MIKERDAQRTVLLFFIMVRGIDSRIFLKEGVAHCGDAGVRY